jgi:hypothetical protein
VPTRGSAAWQRYLKEKHARLVLGAPRSPRLIFHLCEQQPLELRCFGGRTAAMVSARRAPAMARIGGPAAGRPGRASAERFTASQRHQRRCPFEASSGAERDGAPTRERRRRTPIFAVSVKFERCVPTERDF